MEKKTVEDKWEIRMNDAFSLGSSDVPEAVDKLLNYLDDKVWKVRRAAVESLGNRRIPRTLPALIKKLDDEAWQVRQGAAFALGYVCREACKIAVDGDSSEERKSFDFQKETLDILRDKLQNDEEWRVRQACASALRVFERESVSFALLSALKDPDWHVQCTAADSLGEIRDPMAKTPLRNMLKGADPMAKRIFNTALQRIEGKIPVAGAAGTGVAGEDQNKPDSAQKISREELVEMKQGSEGSCSGCTP